MIKPLLLLVTLTLSWTGSVHAALIYEAPLSGGNEVPANASPGTGFVTVVFDPALHTLLVDVEFAGLIGVTTAAHIHCCTSPGTNVGVATPTPTFPGFPLGVTAGNYLQTLDLTLASSFNGSFLVNNGGTPAGAEAALAAGLAAGNAYFNLHTDAFPGGEVRGNLQVPEPASILLLGIGAGVGVGVGGFRRGRVRGR